MGQYRLYIMDAEGIHIDDFRNVSASGDDEAIREALTFQLRCPSELWQGGRLIQAFARDYERRHALSTERAAVTIH